MTYKTMYKVLIGMCEYGQMQWFYVQLFVHPQPHVHMQVTTDTSPPLTRTASKNKHTSNASSIFTAAKYWDFLSHTTKCMRRLSHTPAAAD